MDNDRALIICEDEENRRRVASAALKCGLDPICCSTLAEARALLHREDFRIVLSKENLPDGDFRAALKEVKKTSAHAPLIVLSHLSDWGAYLKALGAGAFDYVVCPPEPGETERILRCALSDTAGPLRAARAAAQYRPERRPEIR